MPIPTNSLPVIDLNCDLGEHDSVAAAQVDAPLLPLVSAINIACGGHVGSPEVMAWLLTEAKRHQCAVGAHPGYADRAHFGRRERFFSARELQSSLTQQLAVMKQLCKQHDVTLHHVKAHGALYNQTAKDPALAHLLCDCVAQSFPNTQLYVLAGSVLMDIAPEYGLQAIAEGFADRRYQANGHLVPRRAEHAVITDVYQVAEHACQLAADAGIQTLCLHGDSAEAFANAQLVRQTLTARGWDIQAP